MIKATIIFLIFGFYSFQAKSAVEVELITIGAGQNYWEAFGHSAIRIKTDSQDLIYGFGYFNFNDEDFFLNFAKGEMQYFLGIEQTSLELDDFSSNNRQIWSQKLSLSTKQKIKLIDKLNFLAKEENRYYDYDYFLNNCTSQLRDLLDEITGGEISAQLTKIETQTSWNDATFPSSNQTWMNLGIAIAYGLPAYKNRNRWQLSVFPEDFAHEVAQLKTSTHWNSPLKLINQIETEINKRSFLKTHYAMILTVSVLMIGILFSLTRSFTINMWLVIQSLLGFGLLLLWFMTKHSVAANNINVLLFFPFSFLLVFQNIRNNKILNAFLIINLLWLVLSIALTNLYLVGFLVINIFVYTVLKKTKY